eukprot:194998_1
MASVFSLKTAYAVIITLIAIASTQSYIYYGDAMLEWHEGNAFCEFVYGTTLASIHNEMQDIEAGSKCPESTEWSGCWIGANILNATSWKWSDGSTFTYGNDTAGGVAPWMAGNPSHAINESCGEIDQATKGWNDHECNDNKPILCNSPSNTSTIVIDDNIHNIRQPVPPTHSFGTMDILDDVHVEFDFKVSSSLRMYSNILHIGSHYNTRLPAIFIMDSAGKPGVKVQFSRIDDALTVTDYGPMSIGTWYHVSFDITQSTTVLSIDGSTVANRTNQTSHAILYNQDIYIMSHFVWLPIDGLIRDLKITTNNAYQTPFNYLCDYENRFSVISGSWSIDTETCWLSQNTSEGGNVVWLGDNDPSSMEWTDYTIELVVNLQSSDLESAAQAGLLFRALSVSSTNNGGQQYWVDIKKSTGIRFRQAVSGQVIGNTNHNTTINWNEDYTIRVKVAANQFSIYLDNKHILDETNSDYSNGSIGIRTHRCKAIFKRLRIIFPNTNTRITLDPTSSPTRHPTTPPTVEPTTLPTLTVDPSAHPSTQPSDHSNHITPNPTLYSTMSSIQSIQPTFSPTVYPMIYPTFGSVLYTTFDTIGTEQTNGRKSDDAVFIVIRDILYVSIAVTGLLLCVMTIICVRMYKAKHTSQVQMAEIGNANHAKESKNSAEEVMIDVPHKTNDNAQNSELMMHVETVVTAIPRKEGEEQCEDCGKYNELLFELDGNNYCRDCRACYDDDADDLFKSQPVTNSGDSNETPVQKQTDDGKGAPKDVELPTTTRVGV